MTRRAFAVTFVAVALGAIGLLADDMSVTADPRTDFGKFRTFAFRTTKIESPRPELDNPLFVKKLNAAIRAAFASKALTVTTANPDLFVDYVLTGEDFGVGVPTAARGVGPQPVRFTEGTLVIDLLKPGDPNPVWRGVYRDDEMTGSKLMQKLPADAKRLIAKYPGRR